MVFVVLQTPPLCAYSLHGSVDAWCLKEEIHTMEKIKTTQVEKLSLYFYVNALVRKGAHLGSH